MSSLVCTGAVVTGLLQTNGRKVVLGAVSAAAISTSSGVFSGVEVTTISGTTITFSVAQTLPAGFQFMIVQYSGQVFTLAAPMVASTTGTLTTAPAPFSGAATAEGIADATWSTGPNEFTFGLSQTLGVGFTFQANGVGQVYTVTTPLSGGTVLPQTSFTPAFAGSAGTFSLTAATGVAPSTTDVLTLPATGATDSSAIAVQSVMQENGEACTIECIPWALALAAAQVNTAAVTVTTNSTAITFGTAPSPVLPAGTRLTFAQQPGVVYTLASPTSGTGGVLTTPYTGTPGGSTTANGVGGTVLTCPGGVFTCVGQNRQPVTFAAVTAANLVP